MMKRTFPTDYLLLMKNSEESINDFGSLDLPIVDEE